MNTDRLEERSPATQSVEDPTRIYAYPLRSFLDESLTPLRRTHDSRIVEIIPPAPGTSTTSNEPTGALSDQCQTTDAIPNPGLNLPSMFTSHRWNRSDFRMADRPYQYTNESLRAMEDVNVPFTDERGGTTKAAHSKYMNGSEISTGYEQGYCMNGSDIPNAALQDQCISPARAPRGPRQVHHIQRSGPSTRATPAQYLNAVRTTNSLPTEFVVGQNVDIEDLVHCAGITCDDRGDLEMTQTRRDMSATVMQVARRGTNEQVQGPAIVAQRQSFASKKRNRSDHRRSTGVEPSCFWNVDRRSPDNRRQEPNSALHHDENCSFRPSLQQQHRKNGRAQNICPSRNQISESFGVCPSGRTMKTAKSKDRRNLPSSANSQQEIAEVICPSTTPGISPHPLHAENNFTNENRIGPGRNTVLEDLPVIQNIMQNGQLGQDLSQFQDPLEECQMDVQSRRGAFLDPSLSDRHMMLSPGESQTLFLSNNRTNLDDTDTALFTETNGNMPVLNTGAILYSREVDSTITFNGQHPAVVDSIQDIAETSMSKQKEREPNEHANAETERHIFGAHSLPDRGAIYRLKSKSRNETGDCITRVENPNTPSKGTVRADRRNASQSPTGQADREPQPQNQEVDICDAKDAFYNYDWTLMSFSERRKRRTQILKSKRLPPSELRIKKIAANIYQKIDFGKVPDNVIIELSMAYPRQRPNRRKTRKARIRMSAQNRRIKARNQLEFHQKENKKLLLRISECKAQRLELTRQLEQAQDRLREREAEVAHLRIDNNRLQTKMPRPCTSDQVLLDH